MTAAPLFSLCLHGRLVCYDKPAVMGIINITDDSFYADSRVEASAVGRRAADLIAQGADMLDIGACSSRPGAEIIDARTELQRLTAAVGEARRAVGSDVPISVDTFRADVAKAAIDAGADIINDISGGDADADMFATVARTGVPYILMHMRGTPATMQQMCSYDNVTADIIACLSAKAAQLQELGVADIIIDPGFGFAKTTEQNYRMLHELRHFSILKRPILVGVSRKSMITKLLGISAAEALCPTAVVEAMAIERGAAIIRTHSPLPAKQAIEIISAINNN